MLKWVEKGTAQRSQSIVYVTMRNAVRAYSCLWACFIAVNCGVTIFDLYTVPGCA